VANLMKVDPTQKLLTMWKRLSPLPGGKLVFSRVIGKMIPYTGSIKANVMVLEPGHCVVELQDRMAVRNHLSSVHALALANLGEFTSGLAMTAALPPGARGIVTGLSIEYVKKARGKITAETHCTIPELREKTRFDVVAELRDESKDVVARFKANWQVSAKATAQESVR